MQNDPSHREPATEERAARKVASRKDRPRYASAVRMARRGRYADASRFLQQSLDAGECSDAEALDLQAKIYAQQGLYLHAETCWRRAQSADPSNTTYSEALERLKRGRRPWGPFDRVSVLAAGLAVLSFLLWQWLVVLPANSHRQVATDRRLESIQDDLATLRVQSDSWDRRNAEELAKLRAAQGQLEEGLSSQLDTLVSDERAANNRAAVVQHLDEAVAELQAELAQRLAQFEQRQGQTETVRSKTIEALDQQVEQLAIALAQLHDFIDKQDGSVIRDIEQVEQRLAQLDQRLAEVEKRDAEKTATHASLMETLQSQLADWKRMLNQTSSNQEEAAARDRERLQTMATDLAKLVQDFSSVQVQLESRITALREDVNRDMKLLATSEELSASRTAVNQLQRQVEELIQVTSELRAAEASENTGARQPTPGANATAETQPSGTELDN